MQASVFSISASWLGVTGRCVGVAPLGVAGGVDIADGTADMRALVTAVTDFMFEVRPVLLLALASFVADVVISDAIGTVCAAVCAHASTVPGCIQTQGSTGQGIVVSAGRVVAVVTAVFFVGQCQGGTWRRALLYGPIAAASTGGAAALGRVEVALVPCTIPKRTATLPVVIAVAATSTAGLSSSISDVIGPCAVVVAAVTAATGRTSCALI